MKLFTIFLFTFTKVISNDQIVELPIGLTENERLRIH